MGGLTEAQRSFVDEHPSAAMITTGKDGTPRVARVGIALVDGQLWSSGTESRVRTARLRRDPRCTLFVPDPGFAWLALKTTVEIFSGPEAAEMNLRLFRVMQRRPTGKLSWFGGEHDDAAFLKIMVDEAARHLRLRLDRHLRHRHLTASVPTLTQ